MSMARRAQAGFTLIEAMMAMAVLLIGSLGLLSLHKLGLQLNSDARITTRATGLAEDLITQMQSWDYANDPRMQDSNTSNDATYSDPLGAFDREPVDTAAYDHAEPELEGSGSPWLGVPTADAQAAGFTRYWNIAQNPADVGPNGVLTGVRVAVIVRWVRDGVGRHITLTTFIRNPQVTN
jgi:prepilin-type N-terminal cleavage/methylation domain-containing protein